MMQRLLLTTVVVLLGNVAFAQGPFGGFGPTGGFRPGGIQGGMNNIQQSSPTFSPYLLLRGANSGGGGLNNAGLSYYGLVRPIQELRNNSSMLQQQITDTQNGLETGLNSQTIGTGTRSRFLSTGGYFQNLSGGSSSGSGSSGTGILGASQPMQSQQPQGVSQTLQNLGMGGMGMGPRR